MLTNKLWEGISAPDFAVWKNHAKFAPRGFGCSLAPLFCSMKESLLLSSIWSLYENCTNQHGFNRENVPWHSFSQQFVKSWDADFTIMIEHLNHFKVTYQWDLGDIPDDLVDAQFLLSHGRYRAASKLLIPIWEPLMRRFLKESKLTCAQLVKHFVVKCNYFLPKETEEVLSSAFQNTKDVGPNEISRNGYAHLAKIYPEGTVIPVDTPLYAFPAVRISRLIILMIQIYKERKLVTVGSSCLDS